MSEFKLGDKVRVRLDARKYTEDVCGWPSIMDKIEGVAGVVTEVHIVGEYHTVEVFFKAPIGCHYWYDGNSLEKLINEDKQMETTKLKLELDDEIDNSISSGIALGSS